MRDTRNTAKITYIMKITSNFTESKTYGMAIEANGAIREGYATLVTILLKSTIIINNNYGSNNCRPFPAPKLLN